ncbi:CDP-alcohol phosphatidyltransferase family protein [Rhodoblastus sp.]|uniref:CDP-alcohol phosphatidyltransferase family protein n=1 Tax=Rhodoblastus sp. TaxID=1962975 RepID=UPI003F99FA0B
MNRKNSSFLAHSEQKLIQWILPRIPARTTSLHLTGFGMVGSFAAAVALIGCNWSHLWLPIVALGISINWFGDSLDGALARFRNEERPRFGFLVDHTCDLFSTIMLIVAFGFSPFLSLVAALSVLLCYLLFSSYTYIRAAAHHVHQMSYLGLGGTEFRILMIGWSYLAAFLEVRQPLVNGLSGLDIGILALAAIAVVALATKAIGDARDVAFEENMGLGGAPELAQDDVGTAVAL